MALRDILKISRKTFLNPSGWIDYDSLKAQNQTIWTALKGLFTPQKPLREETFAEAKERLGLTEEDVATVAKDYRNYALIFVAFGFMVFFYAFYILFRYTSFTGWLLAIAASALFFGQAFKFDFWSFQMRRRKLGATFEEWKQSVLGDKGSAS